MQTVVSKLKMKWKHGAAIKKDKNRAICPIWCINAF